MMADRDNKQSVNLAAAMKATAETHRQIHGGIKAHAARLHEAKMKAQQELAARKGLMGSG
jgi:hypothetical protein